jgi:outer membrane protein assembly factor BamA
VLNNNLSPEVDSQISISDKQDISNIEERRQRLTENNLILTTNYTYTRNTRKSLTDNNFNRINMKLEFAGNTLSSLSDLLGLEKNSNDRFELFNVAYSQYVKTEVDYIKYWSLSKNNTLAFRGFFGIAIPYGNSNSIPFSRSFFGGGSNDNRAWDAYSLGPGISGGKNEFNEANMKIAFNSEYRYTLFGDLKGAFFIDAGNIWNVLDNEEDPEYKFESIKDLNELAIGSGMGFRYDFGFFVLRFDVGFKTYEPYLKNKKWLRNYNFKNAVYNVGINYPF